MAIDPTGSVGIKASASNPVIRFIPASNATNETHAKEISELSLSRA
jgi:hypothetical protein